MSKETKFFVVVNRLNFRGLMYNLLARTLDYPKKDLLNKFRTSEMIREKTLLEDFSDVVDCYVISSIKKRFADINDYLNSFEDEKEMLLELQKDYTWMFIASKPRLVPPFESVYKENRLMQESTFNIARLYYKAGLKPEKNFGLLPDHIALELEFMGYLCLKELEGHQMKDNIDKGKKIQEKSRELQIQVLENHLGKFYKQLTERLKNNSRTGFYENVAELCETFVDWEVKELNIHIES